MVNSERAFRFDVGRGRWVGVQIKEEFLILIFFAYSLDARYGLVQYPSPAKHNI